MDGPKTGTESTAGNSERNGRKRRWEMTGENIRYFLPKSGASSERPELGQEMASEGEALVQAFKSGQVFYTVVAWKAVPEINGNERVSRGKQACSVGVRLIREIVSTCNLDRARGGNEASKADRQNHL